MMVLTVWLGVALTASTPLPTPTDPAFDPVKVTPGPVGFFMTAGLFLAVGVIAMSLMRRSARANARFDIREELAREAAERDAGAASVATGAAPADSAPADSAPDDSTSTDSARTESARTDSAPTERKDAPE